MSNSGVEKLFGNVKSTCRFHFRQTSAYVGVVIVTLLILVFDSDGRVNDIYEENKQARLETLANQIT